MCITLQELLEHSFVITINDKRFNNFCKVFNEHNLNPLPKRFNGYTLPNDIYKDIGLIKSSNVCNCSFSHASIVKAVEALNWPFVCIFEDDAFPHKNIVNKLQNILMNIPNEIDMIKIGYSTIKTKKLINYNSVFYSNAQTIGSHAYIIFNKYYSKYQSIFNKNAVADLDLMNSKNNILTSVDNLFIQYTLDTDYISLHNSADKYLKEFNLNNYNICQNFQ